MRALTTLRRNRIMAEASLSAARLREVLHYDAETGIFTRKLRTAQRHQIGDRADFQIAAGASTGYRRVSVDSERYLAHRVAWLYVHGEWPREFIDHVNGVRSDNRVANLRPATHRLNMENRRTPRADNACGFLGVVFHAPTEQWRARIQVKGKGRHIGLYPTPELAHAAYVAAKRTLHEGCTL